MLMTRPRLLLCANRFTRCLPACSGLGVMLGYSNPGARMARESCTTAVAMQASLREAVEAGGEARG
jgi:hypothetical protein